jgi:hypothetical protein
MQPIKIMDIPALNDYETFKKNKRNAELKKIEYCPCCGKGIKTPKYFINSIWGGSMYPAIDKTQYNDSWIMSVGSECRKKLPKEYVMTKNEL